MASVFRATDVALGRTVAVKLFRNDSLDGAGPERQSGEIALLASLNHFALVTLYDAGTTEVDGAPRTFIVMEFVDGPDLRSRIAGGPLRSVEVAEMGADLAEALHYVHAKGIIHRDVKPANVLLTPSDFPGRLVHAKLADFGIARLLDETRLTVTGTLIGTASYLSPEQALGAPLGPPTDVYSLGLVLLECLTGERAYPGTAVESAMARLQRQPEIPATLDRGWRELLTAMTSREPADRPNASAASVALRALSSGTTAEQADHTESTQILSGASAPGAMAQPPADVPSHTLVLPVQTAATERLPSSSTTAPSTTAPSTTAASPANAAAANAATEIFSVAPSAAPAAAPASRVAPAKPAGAKSAAAKRDARPPRRKRVFVVTSLIVVALIAAIAFVLFPRPTPQGPPPPNYPAVDGPLGADLRKLQESVEP